MREPRPDWSPLGVNFKILDEHPYLFIYRVPPAPPGDLLVTVKWNLMTVENKLEEKTKLYFAR